MIFLLLFLLKVGCNVKFDEESEFLGDDHILVTNEDIENKPLLIAVYTRFAGFKLI